MELPKYIRARNGTYHYQRDYPTKLRPLIGRKTFTYPLKLSVNSASQTDVKKGAIEAEEAFERTKLLITNSDPCALSESDLDKAAADFLRKRALHSGQLVKVPKEEEEVPWLDILIPETEAIGIKLYNKEPLTAQERVVERAAQKLVNKVKAKPPTLASLWQEYVDHRGIDRTTRGGQKSFKYWERWISLAGDTLISPSTLDHINEGMDAYVAERQKHVKSQSITRELSDIAACLRFASRRYRYGWSIELPLIKPSPVATRHPLEPSEQIALVEAIFAPNSSIKPKYGVALLLCLQGGMMTSEIGRLEPEDIGLDADIPHLKVVNDTKNQDRKRIVPIVLGLELIKEHLDDTIRWLRRTTESTPSGTLKKVMRRTLNHEKVTPHWLRHTFKLNAQIARVSVLTIASIAGWTDGERKASSHLLNYGSSGISQSKMMAHLYQDSLKIHEHLIPLQTPSASNVVVFKRK